MNFSFKTVIRNIYEALRSASLYTVAISVILLVFIANTGYDTAAIVFRDYVTIILVSLLIAFANLLFKIKVLPRFISYILHYTVLVIGITAVFVFSDKLLLKNNPSQSFSLLFVFTVLYVLFALLIYLIKKATKKISSRLPSDPQEKTKKQEDAEEEYHSIL